MTHHLFDYDTGRRLGLATPAQIEASDEAQQGDHPGGEFEDEDGRWVFTAEHRYDVTYDEDGFIDWPNQPEGATGVRWTDNKWTECVGVIHAYEQNGMGPEIPGEWLFDPALTGEDDCACDTHAEIRRDAANG